VLLTKAGHLNHDSPIRTEWKISERMMDEENFQNRVYQYKEMNIMCEQNISTNPIKRSAKDNLLHTKDKIMQTREMREDKQS
jgi:hypothetical protein